MCKLLFEIENIVTEWDTKLTSHASDLFDDLFPMYVFSRISAFTALLEILHQETPTLITWN